jgi:hypothetical protein
MACARAAAVPPTGPHLSDPEILSAAQAEETGETLRFQISSEYSLIVRSGDIESGTIYVLRSLSDNRFVAEHRDLIHKIGVTGGKVETRIADAANDSTYLLAGVEIVATYKLSNVNRIKLENIFHRVFAGAQIDLTIQVRIPLKVNADSTAS